jgi:ABC-type transport system involved in multi-copper enzyme maturation permease subunit
MMASLYAEFRKFLTVRSTYIGSGLALLLGGFVAFWGIGYKGSPDLLRQSDALQHAATDVVSLVGVFVGILAILLICHEYRYNTISYTLTASNSRFRVLISKMIVTAAYALLMTFVAIAITIALVSLGANMAGVSMGAQSIDFYSLLWKTIAYTVGSAWLGLVLGFLSRSLVFALVMYFLIPMVEEIMNNLLKISPNYLPTAAQNQILQTNPGPDVFSPIASLGVFAIYMAVGFIASSALFIKRDAS